MLYFTDNYEFAFRLAAGSLAVLTILGLALTFITRGPSKADITKAAAAAEAKRLREVHASMPAAAWETYMVQVENRRLLEELNARQKRPAFGVGLIHPADRSEVE